MCIIPLTNLHPPSFSFVSLRATLSHFISHHHTRYLLFVYLPFIVGHLYFLRVVSFALIGMGTLTGSVDGSLV